jgi:hypothetical protein
MSNRTELAGLIEQLDPDRNLHYGVLSDNIAVFFLLPRGLVERREQERDIIIFASDQIQNDVRGADLANAVADRLGWPAS